MAHIDTKQTRTKIASRFLKTRSRKAGLPPGSVVYTGEQKVDTVRITVFDYDTQDRAPDLNASSGGEQTAKPPS